MALACSPFLNSLSQRGGTGVSELTPPGPAEVSLSQSKPKARLEMAPRAGSVRAPRGALAALQRATQSLCLPRSVRGGGVCSLQMEGKPAQGIISAA